MKRKTKNKFLICLIAIAIALLAAFFGGADKAYAYTHTQLNEATVINIGSSSSTYKFSGRGLNDMAEAAGYADLTAMINDATAEGKALAPNFENTVVQLGTDHTSGGGALKWIPVYLSSDNGGNATLTLWLATDIYKSTWSDGTYSSAASKEFNGSTIYCNSYDGSFIRHKLNGKTGWTTGWGSASGQEANENIGTMVSDFYGSGELASFVTKPANVSWQANAGYLKNDPEWVDGSVDKQSPPNGTGENYPSDWLNDNVWMPSVYETSDSTVKTNSGMYGGFERNGGLWQLNQGNIYRINNTECWLRTSLPSYCYFTFTLEQDGRVSSYNVYGAYGVRPAIHINLKSAAAAAEPDHVHNFGAWTVTTPATCTTKGEKQRICTADGCRLPGGIEKEDIAIDPNAHKFDTTTWQSDETNHWHAATCEHSTETKDSAPHDWNSGTVTTSPTCTQEGVKTFTCNTCGQTKTEPVAKSAHNYSTTWSKDETNHWHVCEDCGAEQPGSKTAHSGGTANCQQKATCSVCGQTYGSLGDHDLEHHDAKTPTCTEIGWNAYDTCKLCDYTTYSELAKIVHTPSDWKTDDEPTCTEEGTKHKECTVCHTTLEMGTIPETGHDYSAEWTTDSTNHWHICANECGIKGDNTAHTFTWIVDKAASFTETGLRHEECNVCHLKRNENTEIPLVTCLHEHTTHHDKVPATCVEKGTVEYKYCSDCNKNLDMSDVELSDLEIPVDPNNHDWGEWEVTEQSTCTEKGTETRICADCGHEETRDIAIDPNAHDLEHHQAQAATCTEIGWEEYDSCTRTGCDYSTYVEIAAKGHDFSITVSGTQPTCQQGGTATMKCSRCEETETQDSANPVDHVYTNYVSDGNATCTQNGTKTAQCDFGCGATDTIEDEGSATGHTPGEEASCTTPQTCTVCNTELAPALGHDWATEWSKDETNHWHICSRCDEKNEDTAHTYEWVITKEATTEEAGLMENLCTVCQNKDGEQEIAKLVDPNGEIDLPVDINVEFKVTQSSTGNNYSDIDNSLKLGYWAQLWYRNDDGTLGDEFEDQINCFLTLKIPTDIIEAIRGGEEINRDKIAAGLKVFYIDSDGLPVEVDNFTIAMRDDDSWQIKFNYNEKFRAEVVFAADLAEQPTPEPETGIPWWVWLLVILGSATLLAIIIVIIVVAKNKKNNNGGTPTDNGEVIQRLDNQDQILNELLTRGDDGGFNTPVELDENGNVIFK